jgi:hypothetical protein
MRLSSTLEPEEGGMESSISGGRNMFPEVDRMAAMGEKEVISSCGPIRT